MIHKSHMLYNACMKRNVTLYTALLLLLNTFSSVELTFCPSLKPPVQCCSCLAQRVELGVQVARLAGVECGMLRKAAQAIMHIDSNLQVMRQLYVSCCCVRIQHTTAIGNHVCHFVAANAKHHVVLVSPLAQAASLLYGSCTGNLLIEQRMHWSSIVKPKSIHSTRRVQEFAEQM